MPALLTHYLCGGEVLQSIDISGITDTTSKYRNLFNLGTQGPDIFFYHNAYPCAKGESLDKLGGRLHNEKVKSFFRHALKAIDKAHGEEKERLLSYIYGYACHYSLDIHAHPYIFYKTGFVLDDGDKKKYDAYHRRFEAEIDAIMARKVLHKRAHEIPFHELIAIDKDEADAIAGMYHYILKNTFQLDISIECIEKAPSDMASIIKTLRDPLGMKKAMIAFAEKMVKRHHLISNMIYPLKIDESLDHLNLQHSTWYYPWDKSYPQHSSFIELFHGAIGEAKIMCKNINEYANKDIDINEVLCILGNRSFESGLDCDENVKFKYYHLIYA
ncbi:MAG: zinc dependent phospholipase C family protein [Lutispora sp.]|nr:zinc dependent phospholipase C family protein [Lutispora sp.]